MSPAFVLTQADLAVLTGAVLNNVSALLPVGIGIMAILIGVSLIPRIVYKFL